MKVLLFPPFNRRILLTSIATFAGLCTALHAFQSINSYINHQTCSKKAPMSEITKKPKFGILMVDFDLTCTMKDTTSLHYHATQAYRAANTEEQLSIDRRWEKLSKKYLREYFTHLDQSLSKFRISEKYDESGLLSHLKVMGDFNAYSTKQVDETQLLKGVDDAGVKWAASQVILYPGCLDLLKAFKSRVRVVSINWSSELIGYSLDDVISQRHIFANKLLDDNGKSSGVVAKDMITSFDKLRIVNNLLDESELKGVSVFVGDSITDLLALIKADIGIIIGQSSSILNTASIFGIKIEALSTLLVNNDLITLHVNDKCKLSPTLFKTDNWFEIAQLVSNFS